MMLRLYTAKGDIKMNDKTQNRCTAISALSGRQSKKGTGLTCSYNIWLIENRNKISQKDGKINKELAKKMWRELGESGKKPYKGKAKQIREEHMRLYPNYKKNYSREVYLVFYYYRKIEVALKNPGIGYHETRRLIGEEWKQLNENEKIPFFEEAKLRREKKTQLYSNEYHPHKNPKIAANPKMSASSIETKLRSPPHDATSFVTPQIGEHDSDNQPNMLSLPNALQFLSINTGGHQPSSVSPDNPIFYDLNMVSIPNALQFLSHDTGGHTPSSDAPDNTTFYHPNMLSIPNYSQFLSHDTGGNPPLSDAPDDPIFNHPNRGNIPSASQFISHDARGYPPSSDADESINFQLNPVSTSSLTGAFPGFNETHGYCPQPDDHNIFNQDMLNCCEKFINCYPRESHQMQQDSI